MTALPYDFIGAYRVTEVIGRGGFATVFRAVDERLDDDVAIKVLADNYATDADIRARFLGEGRLLRKIDNQHLIRVHDVGETERSQPYLVLELADRGDLNARVEALRASGWHATRDDIAVLSEALLGAAGALHASDLVHRDLKPDNVLLRSTSRTAPAASPDARLVAPDERLMVSDLGFTKDLAAHSGFTIAGGTAAFGAPEQFRGDRVTPQTDLYAIGQIIEWLIAEDPPKRWHDDLRRAVAPAIDEDPARRPTSAAVMLASVQAALRTDSTDTAAAGRPLADPSSSETAPNRKLNALIAAVVAVAVLIIGGIALWPDGDSNRSEVSELGNGKGQTSVQNDGSTVTITGPLEVVVGDQASLAASGIAADQLTWIMPDGKRIEGVAAIDISTFEPGRATVELLLSPDGDAAKLDYTFDVVAGP